MSQSTEDISRKTPVDAPVARTEVVRESRLRILSGNVSASARRWWAQTVQRGHLRESLKSLIVVSLLTMLIWVWAETQQMLQDVQVSGVEVKIVTSDREKFVAVRDVSPVVTIELSGPKTGVEDITRELTSTVPPKYLEIDVGSNLPVGARSIAVLERIRDLPIFRQSGVSVTKVTPANIAIDVDSMKTLEVDVVPPTEVADKVQNVVFDPPKITVRGPGSVVNRNLSVYADMENAEQLKQPGPQTIPSVRLFTRPLDRNIAIDPPVVQAKFDVKGDEKLEKGSLTIQPTGSVRLLDSHRVVFENGDDFIRTVTFIGPKDVIEEMKRSSVQPQALLILEDADKNGRRSKRLVYVNLPKGVRVSPEDEKREVTFHLEERQQ